MLKFGDSGHGRQSLLGVYPHPTNQTTRSTVTPRFKPFTVLDNLKRKNRSQNESEQSIFISSTKNLHLSYNSTLSDTQGLFKKEIKTFY